MRNYKRNIFYILSILILTLYTGSSKDYDEYFQISAQYNNGKLNLSWVMYDFEFQKADLYIRPGRPSNNVEDIEKFKTKIDIRNNIYDSVFSSQGGRDVKIYMATINYEMESLEEVVVLNIKTKDYNFLSFASMIKKNNGNPNTPNIIFENEPPKDPLIGRGSTLEHDFDAKAKDGNGEVKYEIFNSTSSKNIDAMQFATLNEDTGEFSFKAEISGRYAFTIQAYIMSQGAKQVARQSFVFQVDTCEVPSKINVTLIDQDGNTVPDADLFLISKGKSNMETELFVATTDNEGFASISAIMGTYYLIHYQKNGMGIEQFYNNSLTPDGATEIVINDCAIVKEIEFKIKTGLDSNNLFGLKFTKLPSLSERRVKIGEEVSFKIEAKLKDTPNAVIKYGLQGSDEGMEINSETGEFTWTPTKAGSFYATFIAEVEGNIISYPVYETITFDVSNCTNPGSIIVEFKDKDGNNLDNNFKGIARLFVLDNKNSNQNDDIYWRLKTSKEQEISYSFAGFSVDEGEYLLLVESKNNFYWYNNAKDIEDAEIIKTQCNDTTYLTMIIDQEKYKEETVRISGYCLDQNGNVVKSRIILEGGRANGNGMKEHIVMNVENNDNGYYSVELPKDCNFIAYAFSQNSNRPLYYNQTYNHFDAEYIKTNKERNDINFIFGEAIDTTNNPRMVSVGGTVVSNENEIIEDVFVVSLRTDVDTKPKVNSGITYLAIDGTFEFELEVGNYVFLAIPQSNEFIPGFYNENGISSMIWEEASVVNLNNVNSIELNIILQNLERKPGIARINGNVNSEETKANIDNASIMLLDEETAVEYAVTNINGEFDFPNVADGEYILVVNKVGYKSYQSNVILDSQEPLNMDIELEAVQGTLDIDNDFEYADINIFPNPSSEYIKIENRLNYDFNKFEILGLGGETLISNDFTNNLEINIGNLPSGKYFIKLSNNQNSVISSFTVVR